MRKWCKRCGQRFQVMKPGHTCKMCGWVWEKPKNKKGVKIIK